MIGDNWGATDAERAAPLPCDDVLDAPNGRSDRAISIAAPPSVVFRWLCQLKVAPYSYDLIDNFGRRSPRHLTPGAEHLEHGQRVMTVFRIVSFAPDEHLTIRTSIRRLRMQVAVTYAVRPVGTGTRLVARVMWRFPNRPAGVALRAGMPMGDLIMMRKQLRTLKELAERNG